MTHDVCFPRCRCGGISGGWHAADMHGLLVLYSGLRHWLHVRWSSLRWATWLSAPLSVIVETWAWPDNAVEPAIDL